MKKHGPRSGQLYYRFCMIWPYLLTVSVDLVHSSPCLLSEPQLHNLYTCHFFFLKPTEIPRIIYASPHLLPVIPGKFA